MCGPLDHGLVAEALQDDSGRPLDGLGREVDHRNPRTTTMPSSSECTVCPGVTHTPPISTGPLTTPTPVLLLFSAGRSGGVADNNGHFGDSLSSVRAGPSSVWVISTW